MATAPVFHIDPASFQADPYPALRKMQQVGPVVFVPELNATLLTRRDTIFENEKRIDIFSSNQPGGLMTVLMGENMMRKDGEAHLTERRQMFPAVSPRTVRDVWTTRFRSAAEAILRELRPKGVADLVSDYAMRVSGEALRELTGLSSMTAAEIDSSSQAMIDGCANYAGIPAVEDRCHQGTALIDEHIDRMAGRAGDYSILRVLQDAGQPMDQIRANIKLTISGGQNEPRDAIAGCIWALLTHPEEFGRVQRGEADWQKVFAEYVRWMSPIGMSPRRVARAVTVERVSLKPDDRVFFMFGAANRDPDHFEDPDRFDLTRDASAHIAFGAGPHFCAGAWASKALVAEVALPLIFEYLPGLRLRGPARMDGWAFRGLRSLPVAWNT
jgi:cytochrome P450